MSHLLKRPNVRGRFKLGVEQLFSELSYFVPVQN